MLISVLKRFDAATAWMDLSMTGDSERFLVFYLLFREKSVIKVRRDAKRFDTPKAGGKGPPP